MKVTAQYSKYETIPKTIFNCVDWHFICSVYPKYSGVISNGHFSTHAFLDSLLCSISHSLDLLLSFSLSLPLSRLLRTLFFPATVLYKRILILYVRHNSINLFKRTLFLTWSLLTILYLRHLDYKNDTWMFRAYPCIALYPYWCLYDKPFYSCSLCDGKISNSSYHGKL